MSRARVLEAAVAELGPGDVPKYWRDVLAPGDPIPHGLAWCGVFALYCLHQAGLALDRRWRFGLGFLLVGPHPLHLTKTPLPGDVGYVAHPFQHHFLVESVDGSMVHSIDGNQPGVARRTRHIEAAVYYSIQPLLDAAVGDPDKSVTC